MVKIIIFMSNHNFRTGLLYLLNLCHHGYLVSTGGRTHLNQITSKSDLNHSFIARAQAAYFRYRMAVTRWDCVLNCLDREISNCQTS